MNQLKCKRLSKFYLKKWSRAFQITNNNYKVQDFCLNNDFVFEIIMFTLPLTFHGSCPDKSDSV